MSWGQREGGVRGHWSTGRASHVRMPRTQTQALHAGFSSRHLQAPFVTCETGGHLVLRVPRHASLWASALASMVPLCPWYSWSWSLTAPCLCSGVSSSVRPSYRPVRSSHPPGKGAGPAPGRQCRRGSGAHVGCSAL